MRLADIVHLARPGDGGFRDDLWSAFMADDMIKSLDWPPSVVEQFLFDHGRNPDFLEEYGQIALESVEWVLVEVPAQMLVEVVCAPYAADYLMDCVTSFEHWYDQRPANHRQSWETTGSWLVPPLLLDRGLLQSPASGFQIVEGHTRIGLLRGRLTRGADPEQLHLVYVGSQSL